MKTVVGNEWTLVRKESVFCASSLLALLASLHRSPDPKTMPNGKREVTDSWASGNPAMDGPVSKLKKLALNQLLFYLINFLIKFNVWLKVWIRKKIRTKSCITSKHFCCCQNRWPKFYRLLWKALIRKTKWYALGQTNERSSNGGNE